MWQAQFLSYVLLILGNSLFFKDKQMILVTLFDISTGLRFQKILKSFPIQVLSHPWISYQWILDFKPVFDRSKMTQDLDRKAFQIFLKSETSRDIKK